MAKWLLNLCLFFLIIIHSVRVYSESNIVVENLNEKFNLGTNQVYCMYQDSIGFLWFGMASGLYKYDNTAIKYIETSNSKGLNHPDIRDIVEYSPGYLLLGTYDYGLIVYNSLKERFDTVTFNTDFSLDNLKIECITIDSFGMIWVGTRIGLYKIKLLDKSANTFELLQFYNGKNSGLYSDEIVDLKLSNEGNIWFLTAAEVGVINGESNTLKNYLTNESNTSFTFFNDNRIVISCYGAGLKIFDIENQTFDTRRFFNAGENTKARYVYKDKNDNLWLSISNVGLYLLDSKLDISNSTLISNNSQQHNSLNSNVIFGIGESRDGTIFSCSNAGINSIKYRDNFFSSFSSIFDKNNLAYGIRSLYNIDNENVLIGSMGAGIKLLNVNKSEIIDLVLESPDYELSKNIQSILKDKQGNIWIGTEGYGLVKIKNDQTDILNKPKFVNYRAFPRSFPEKSVLNDFVMCLLEDDQENLWIGTWYGLSLFSSKERFKPDQQKAEITNFLYNPNDKTALSSNTIMCLLKDNLGNIWAGTQNGLNKVISNNNKYKFDSNIKDSNGNLLTEKTILSIFQAANGKIWFSTHDGGLCLLDPEKMMYEEYNSQNGFINYVINTIQEDDQGNLWLGTSDGICRFDPTTFSYNLYSTDDGLITNLFLLNSSCKIGDKIFLGGDKGIVCFSPEDIKQKQYDIKLVLTDIKVYNKSISVQSKASPLQNNISNTSNIDFNYNQNFLTFEFASLNFKKQKDIQYSCILEGVESSWNEIGNEHKVTYAHLTHGSYVFKVKAYDSGYHNNFEQLSLNITVHPPYWKTKVAYLIYILLFVFSMYKLYTFFLNQEKKKNALALEKLDAKKEHEIDLMKLRFFMNVSHEFRTPLTLLSAPLETLMKGELSEEKTQSYFQLMHQNVQRLKRLIDELLMVRKIDAGYLKMEWKLGNIVDFTRKNFDSFQNYAEKRHIHFVFNSSVNEIFTYFDADKLDKVLFNLVSNAFKYTQDGGYIELSISKIKNSNSASSSSDAIKINIKDSGVGIPKASIQGVFERFQNNEKNKPIDSASTGIGLSLAKELIELHTGEIQVQSIEDQGSTFTIILPVIAKNPQAEINNEELSEEFIDSIHLEEDMSDNELENQTNQARPKPLILLVEDQEELRNFLADEFGDSYELIQSANGVDGLDMAIKNIPDLIVSDIMMDKMDGIALCKKIKTDERTSHIPVILLTARHADTIKLDSYQIGADGFITKPFSVEILKSRIDNLIKQRRKLRAKFTLGIDNQQNLEEFNTLDSKFIEKLNKLINENIDNSDLTPTYLATELAMSRMQLYRKVAALTDQTVNNYIRTIRLNKAAQLLLTTDLQVAEIAFKVGYSEPSNFTKSFGKHFNQTPLKFASSNKKS